MLSTATAASDTPPPPEARRIGRFVLRELLGRGAHSEVHRAHDAALDRDVAIKLLKPGPKQDARTLLAEARAVSRLRHPGIVPVHEAGLHQGQPYLVFEYVAGQTLAQVIRREAPLDPARACELISDVLQALQASHDGGIVHRDLKPANILVDAEGTVRVTDFGIASAVEAPGNGPDALRGTPAYMAPEYVERGEVTPQYDLHAAGLILFEMLVGRHPYVAPQAMQTLYRLTHEQAEVPRDIQDRLGSDLFRLLMKAIAKDPAERHGSAQELRRELQEEAEAWRRGHASGGVSRLDRLLREIGKQSDFPTLGTAIAAIHKLSSSDDGDVGALSNSILKDFALTNKILRLANSAYYPRRAGGSVSTVSRAVVVLGLNAVRDVSVSLLLFQHLKDKAHAKQLKNEFLRLNLTALVAQELAAEQAGLAQEEAFIGGLFHNLGRLLACYYFRDDYEHIEHLIGSGREPAKAAVQVLGVTYEALGHGVASAWGLPESLTDSIRHLDSPPAQPVQDGPARLRALSSCAAELSAVIESTQPEQMDTPLTALTRRYGKALELNRSQIQQASQKSRQRLREMASVLQIDLHDSELGRRLLQQPGAHDAPDEGPGIPGNVAAAAECPPPADPNPPTLTGAVIDPAQVLLRGLQEISEAMIDKTPLNQLLGIAAETLYRAIQPEQVLVALADGARRNIRGATGFGDQVTDTLKRFQFPLAPGSDLFSAALRKPADLLIQDARLPKVRDHLPHWFTSRFQPQAFLLLPVKAGSHTLGLIYAHSLDQPLALPDSALPTLRALRNQVALAISQAR